jgi:16S rRNA (uracil1498-N3)-methyltransferase
MLPYFYHKELNAAIVSFTLSEETSKHCIQVLRMQEGEQIKLTNGNGLCAVVEISLAHKKNCIVKIISTVQDVEPIPKNTIAISLLKNNNRFEWFLEKATELGIYEIVPLLCKRTERQVFKEERLQAILISAMLQSQQTFLPKLTMPQKFADVVSAASICNSYIAHCVEQDKKALPELMQKGVAQLILIGPEGDFDEKEIALALTHKFIPVSLGNTRLRTETAGVVAATLLQLV